MYSVMQHSYWPGGGTTATISSNSTQVDDKLGPHLRGGWAEAGAQRGVLLILATFDPRAEVELHVETLL